ncbi:hypothetical protein AWB71_01311 [Caballeronia peredens]|nr:hypothetical protein AWB71_01311 [Caballeronia peredens]
MFRTICETNAVANVTVSLFFNVFQRLRDAPQAFCEGYSSRSLSRNRWLLALVSLHSFPARIFLCDICIFRISAATRRQVRRLEAFFHFYSPKVAEKQWQARTPSFDFVRGSKRRVRNQPKIPYHAAPFQSPRKNGVYKWNVRTLPTPPLTKPNRRFARLSPWCPHFRNRSGCRLLSVSSVMMKGCKRPSRSGVRHTAGICLNSPKR